MKEKLPSNDLGIVWKNEIRKIKDLKPHPKNPRLISSHDAANLERKIQKFGLVDKPTITLDNTIIGGHQRISVLKKMGHTEVECQVPDRDLTDKDIEDLNIGLNRIRGEWDYDILANQFEESDLVDYGFSEQELEMNVEEIDSSNKEDEKQKEKKKKMCPSCGAEF